MIFVDSSAFFAQLSPGDKDHDLAVEAFARVVRADRLVTHSYVVVETTALTQTRLGLGAVRTLNDDILPLIEVRWVDAEMHRAAMSALFAAGRRTTSLVDWTSFEVMRREGIAAALTFDRDFRQQGFETIPGGR
jgi:predicted nucleic acid-binding protein